MTTASKEAMVVLVRVLRRELLDLENALESWRLGIWDDRKRVEDCLKECNDSFDAIISEYSDFFKS